MTRLRNFFRLFFIFALFQFLPQAAQAAGGDLDTTFAAGVSMHSNSNVATVVVQTDGRVLFGGAFDVANGRPHNDLVRFNADGSLDSGFSAGPGDPFAGGTVNALAVQADGRILVGGTFNSFNGSTQGFFVRLNMDGSLDTTFNNGGTGANSWVQTIAIQPNGQILIGGFFTDYNGTAANYFARLNSNGSLDTAFNTNLGTGFSFTPNTIAVQSGGQIVVGGNFNTVNGTTANNIVRLNSNGTLDAGFITNNGTGFNNQVNSVAMQTDGRIVVGGIFSDFNGTARLALARLNSDGTLDTGFASASFNANVNDLQIQANGQIIAAGLGLFGTIGERSDIVRINQADGSLDLGFDAGTAANGFGILSIAPQTDGSVFAGGFFRTFNTSVRDSLTKLDPDGSVNTAFAPVIGVSAQINDLLILPDNRILIGGNFTGVNEFYRQKFARLNADGTTDTTFDPDTGTFFDVSTFAVQQDGRILVTGNSSGNNQLIRLNSDGSLDNTFSFSGTNGTINAIAIQTDGRILIGGNFSFILPTGPVPVGLARLNADGTLDTTFNNGGTGFDSFNANVNDLVLLSSGQILVGGSFTSYNGTGGVNHIARINSNGTLDAGFTTNTGTGFDNDVNTLALQMDGRIVVGGFFNNFDGVNSSQIARLNTNGTRDTGFTVGVGFDGSGGGIWVNDLAVQRDGRILVVGNFINYNGVPRSDLARLNTNGSLDMTLDSGADTLTTVLNTVGFEHCEGIITGGVLNIYSNTQRAGIARVSAGSIRTWTGAANTDWNNSGNWTGGAIPVATDRVIIPNNLTVNLSGGNFSVLNLSVGTNATLNIAGGNSLNCECAVNNGTIAGTGTLNFEGLTLANNGIISASAVNVVAGWGQTKALSGSGSFVGNLLTISSGLRLNLTSNHIFHEINFSGTGTLEATSRTVNLRGPTPLQSLGTLVISGSTLIYDGTSAQTIAVVNYNNLTLNNAAGAGLAGNTIVNGALSLQNGPFGIGSNTLTLNGAVSSVSGNFSSAAGGTVIYNQNAGGQNVVNGNYGNITFSNFNKNITNSTVGVAGTFTPGSAGGHVISGSTFIYNGTSAQTLPSVFTTYNNLTLNNAAGVNGFAGLNVQGLLRVQQGIFSSSSSYNNVQIDNGATLAGVSNTTINTSGNWTNNGTFTANGNTVNFNGFGAQTIGGSSATTFNNLTIGNAAGVNLNAGAVVNNVLTLSVGTLGIGSNTLTINGAASVTGGSFSSNANGTVNYNQGTNGQSVLSGNYGNLTFSNFNKTLPAATVGVAGTFTTGNANGHILTGNTFDFNGAGAQTVPAFSYNNLTISQTRGGATVALPSGMINVAGVFDPSATAVVYGTTGNTFVFGGGAQTIPAFTFNNLTTGGSGAKMLGGAIGVLNALTIGNGTTLNASAGNFDLSIGGIWTNNGTFTPQLGTVNFNGSVAQTVGGSSATNFGNLTISNAAGVTLNSNTTAANLTLSNGNLLMGANTLTITGTIMRTSGHVIGNIRKNLLNGNTFTFAIGTANGYSPVTVNLTGGTTEITANVVQTNHPVLNPLTSLSRYWALSSNGGPFTANLTFNYLQTDVFGNENAYHIARVSGGVPLMFPNDCIGGSACIDTVTNTAFISGVSLLSDWTLSELAPTSANVSVGGKVRSGKGTGISKVSVTLTDSNGLTRMALTNSFGNYRFTGVPAGETYIISVSHKQLRFDSPSRIVNPNGDLLDINFVAEN